MSYGQLFKYNLDTATIHMGDGAGEIYEELDYLGKVEGYLEEVYELLPHIRLFHGFSLDEARVLCHYMECYAAPRNYALLKEGDCGDHLVLILTGAAEVRVEVPGIGSEKIVDLFPGASVGETSMIDGKPRFVGCITTAPTDFAVLTRGALNTILLQAPRLGNKLLLTLLQLMSARMREAYNPDLSGVL